MRIVNRVVLSLVVFFCTFTLVIAQPPAPEPQARGGVGGVGPGGASPIDDYIYILAVVAVLFIVFYSQKLKRQIARS